MDTLEAYPAIVALVRVICYKISIMIVAVAAAPDLANAIDVAVENRMEVAHERDVTLLRDRYRSRFVSALILDFRGIENPDPRVVDRSIREGVSKSVIAVVDQRQVGLAIQTVQRGARDCLPAPVTAVRLRKSIHEAVVQTITIENEDIEYERAPVGVDAARRAVRSLSGRSRAMRDLRVACIRASRSRAPVLLVGEAGSGKEMVARAIHDLTFVDAPYCATNICAIPETLFDATLFGVRQGAYTGAVPQDGLFQKAQGGTLFLDEIGDLSFPLQSKLLRAVEYGRFLPLGAQRETEVSTRLITATNRDLSKAVEERLFREDLLQRISILAIRVPSLREHREDMPEIVASLVATSDREGVEFTQDAIEVLREHSWEGNYRELKAVIERTLVSTDSGTIRSRDLRFTPFL